MDPFKLLPAYQAYLWGGTRLKEEYNKKADLESIAESWELSAHPRGTSIIASGLHQGMPFSQYIKQYPESLGTKYKRDKDFPLLIKLIDAAKNLSIQVHPDNEYAHRVEGGQGKTELWYILDAKPGAYLYYGLKFPITRKEFIEHIKNNTLIEILQKVSVQKGDVFFIEAGTIHAICEGIALVEIQQNSDLTYRIFDYGRLDAEGQPRPLHLDKALDVAKLEPTQAENTYKKEIIKNDSFIVERLIQCKYFTVDSVKVKTEYIYELEGTSFLSLLCTEGAGTLAWQDGIIPIQKGDSVFVPSNCQEFILTGQSEYLLTSL